LRPLQVVPSDSGDDGPRRFLWSDPAGFSEAVTVPQPIALLMTLFDGQRDHAAVRARWAEISGEELPEGLVEGLAQELADHLLLDGPAFRAAQAEALAAFRAGPLRPLSHAEGAYPADPAACAAWLDELWAGGRAHSRSLRDGPLTGLIAPHIDLTRGGVCYGAAYDAVAACEAECFVLLGTAHSSCCWPAEPPLAIATRLDYDTPFGPAPTDQDFLDRFEAAFAAAGGDVDSLYRDELVHRDEHSLEFQTLWLRHLRRERPFTVVPLLLGSLHEFYERPNEVLGPDGLGPLLAGLRQAMAADGREICVIAGADWSHVGPRFGAEQAVAEEDLESIASWDEQALGPLLAADTDGFFGHFAASANCGNVCSVANLLTLRALRPTAEMELLRYEIAFDPEQTVSFAAAALRSS
jgi:hypothetical protein